MEKFAKQFVNGVMSVIADKLELDKEEVRDTFFAVIWENYQANGKANDIIHGSLNYYLRNENGLNDVMHHLGVNDYLVQQEDKLFACFDEEEEMPSALIIVPGTKTLKPLITNNLKRSIREVVIPDSIERIQSEALGWLEIKALVFPNSITEIPNWCCCGCGELLTVTLPSQLKKIGAGAFRYCRSLYAIDIPDSVEEIDMLAFEECDALPEETKQRILQIGGPAAFIKES